MHIIVLQGLNNCGKTSTINILYRNILREFEKVEIVRSPRIGKEINAILDINGVLLGIVSEGDIARNIAYYLSDFLANNCKVVICATRSRGKTVDAVKSCATNSGVVLVNKNRNIGNDMVVDDKKKAEELLCCLKEFLTRN